MDWQQLEHFRATARCEHMGRAAEELGVSQSTLSRSIARLEQHYRIPLFDRVGRGLRLNAYGSALLARVERALLELENGERELWQMAGLAEANVTLGFLATFGTRIVPRLIGEFRETHPAAQFRLLQGPAPTLHQRLIAGDIDLCLTSPRFADADLAWEPLWDEELLAIVPPGHARAGDREIALADLVPKGVESALGVAVPLRVRAPHCARTIGLAWRHDRYARPLVTAFRDHIVSRLRAP
jgi:DNA-binding transcriptional LysR family regulator